GAQLAGAVDDDAFTGLDALLQLHHAGTPCAGHHVHALHRAVRLEAVDERIAADLHDGDLRHHQRLAGWTEDPYFQQHARTQRMVAIGEISTHGHRARGRIDARINGG